MANVAFAAFVASFAYPWETCLPWTALSTKPALIATMASVETWHSVDSMDIEFDIDSRENEKTAPIRRLRRTPIAHWDDAATASVVWVLMIRILLYYSDKLDRQWPDEYFP